MHPVVRATVVVALLSAAGSFAREPAELPPIVVPPSKARGVTGLPAPCGPRTIPEGDVCVPLPAANAPDGVAPPVVTAANAHPNPARGRGAQDYEHVPRLPDRPVDYGAYALPVGEAGKAPEVLSGYDLDLPADAQRHGSAFKSHGHGGVDFSAARGARVLAVALEGQQGDAEVVYVGVLFGTTVATAHAVREADKLRTVVLLFGHLERSDPGVVLHARVAAGAPIGLVGDSGSPGVVHLHLEAREIEEKVDLATLDFRRILDPTVSLATDPRNVLARRAP